MWVEKDPEGSDEADIKAYIYIDIHICGRQIARESGGGVGWGRQI